MICECCNQNESKFRCLYCSTNLCGTCTRTSGGVNHCGVCYKMIGSPDLDVELKIVGD